MGDSPGFVFVGVGVVVEVGAVQVAFVKSTAATPTATTATAMRAIFFIFDRFLLGIFCLYWFTSLI